MSLLSPLSFFLSFPPFSHVATTKAAEPRESRTRVNKVVASRGEGDAQGDKSGGGQEFSLRSMFARLTLAESRECERTRGLRGRAFHFPIFKKAIRARAELRGIRGPNPRPLPEGIHSFSNLQGITFMVHRQNVASVISAWTDGRTDRSTLG